MRPMRHINFEKVPLNKTLAPTATSLSLPRAAGGALTLPSPTLGSIDAYIQAVNRIPMLNAEDERRYVNDLRTSGNVEAARQLILAHLRYVVAITRKYLGYGLPHADLIQEGNVGLMYAVKRFDPVHNARLATYATHWIKAFVHKYVMDNWRVVKIAGTKAQNKLFFNLRSLRNRYIAEDRIASYRENLSQSEIGRMAAALGVNPGDVVEMERRIAGQDVSLEADPSNTDDESGNHAPIAWLADNSQEPSAQLQQKQRENLMHNGVASALAQLDERSRDIVQSRWLNVNDQGQPSKTLHDLATQYRVSAERIRQIEMAAMKKMRTALAGQVA